MDPLTFDFSITGRVTLTPVVPPPPPPPVVVPPVVVPPVIPPPPPPPNPNAVNATATAWRGVITDGFKLGSTDFAQGGFTHDPVKNQVVAAGDRSRTAWYDMPMLTGRGPDPANYPVLMASRVYSDNPATNPNGDWSWIYPHNYGEGFGARDFQTGKNAWDDYFVASDDPDVQKGLKQPNLTGSNTGLVVRSLAYIDGKVRAAIEEYYGHGQPRPQTGATQYSDVVWTAEDGEEIRYPGVDCGYWGGMLKDVATLGKVPLRSGGGTFSTSSYPMLPTVMGADGRILLNSVSAKAPPSDRPLAINDVVFADGTNPDFGAGVGLVTIDGKQYRHWTMCERVTGTFKLGDKYYGTIVKQPFTPPGSTDPKDKFSYGNQGPYYTTMTFYGKSRLYLARIKPDGTASWGNYPDDYFFEETPFTDPIGFEFLPDGRLMVLDGNWGLNPIVYVCDMSAYLK